MSDRTKALLRDEGTSAIALLRAAHVLLGDFVSWEPEAIWLELERQGVDVPVPNRARLMAGVALNLVPSFYWDAIVFEKTALAFDGSPTQADILEEATPAQLAWAVVETAWILRDAKNASWEIGSEPRAYAGIILHRAGFVLAPEPLSFAQHALDRANTSDASELRTQVKDRWSRVSQDHLGQLTLDETPVDVQIARLAAVALHVRERRARAERELSEAA